MCSLKVIIKLSLQAGCPYLSAQTKETTLLNSSGSWMLKP